MIRWRTDPLLAALRFAIGAAAAWYLIVYFVLAALRVHYPFELEWLEGGGLEHVRRLLEGRALYARPSMDFIPFPYTPLYFYICAAIARMIGHVDFVSMRLVSIAASIGVFAFITAIVRRETGRWYPAWVACGLMAATYNVTDGWFDLARVDSLFLMTLLAAIYAVQRRTPLSFVLGGILFGLSFLIKQTALLIAVPMLVWSVLFDRRKSAFVVIPAAVVMVATTLYFEVTSEGWYWYYVVRLQRTTGFFVGSRLLTFWTEDLLPTAIALLLSGVYLFAIANSTAKRRTSGVAVAAVAMVAASWAARLRSGNAINAVMPAYAALSILCGLAVAHFEILQMPKESIRRRLVVNGICLVQFLVLGFNPTNRLPTRQDEAAGKQLVARIASFNGDVFVPCHGYLAVMAGKRNFVHQMELTDIEGDPEEAQAVNLAIRASFAHHRFSAVLPCLAAGPLERDGLSDYYTKQEDLFLFADPRFRTNAGFSVRPEAIYVPAIK